MSKKETRALTINIYHISLKTSLDQFHSKMHMHSSFTTIALLAIGASAIPLDVSMSNRRWYLWLSILRWAEGTRANNANDALTKRLEVDQGYEGAGAKRQVEGE